MNLVLLNNLSVRELRNEIKNKAYERLSYADKNNIKLITQKDSLSIEDMIKEPILIKENKKLEKLNELVLHKYLIEMVENRFLELGTGFALIGHEYKLKVENKTYKIDLLFFNVELNRYVVIEIKTREMNAKDIGQLKFYVRYINKNIKKNMHELTIGVLIVKKKNKYVIEYTTSKDIYITTYKITS